MKLIANECCNCRRVLGYVVTGTLCLPTLCILCAGDKDTLKEWGHRVCKKEKPVLDVMIGYRNELNRRNLEAPKARKISRKDQAELDRLFAESKALADRYKLL